MKIRRRWVSAKKLSQLKKMSRSRRQFAIARLTGIKLTKKSHFI